MAGVKAIQTVDSTDEQHTCLEKQKRESMPTTMSVQEYRGEQASLDLKMAV